MPARPSAGRCIISVRTQSGAHRIFRENASERLNGIIFRRRHYYVIILRHYRNVVFAAKFCALSLPTTHLMTSY